MGWEEIEKCYAEWSFRLHEIVDEMKEDGMPMTPAYGYSVIEAVKMKIEEAAWWLEMIRAECCELMLIEKKEQGNENEIK